MRISLKLPKHITKHTIGRTILDLDSIGAQQDIVTLDFSDTEYLDTEGMNYLGLLPYYIQNMMNKSVAISLPKSEAVLSFMDHTGLLQIMFDEFHVNDFSCVEDTMFLIKRYKKSRYQNVRIGVVTKKDFQSFLRLELNNLERILNNSYFGNQFCACFYEITKNIFDHSGETIGGFSFHLRKDSNASRNSELNVTISDIGYGIKSTLGRRLDIDPSENDSVYISEALKKGVTGTGDLGRGNGLALVKDMMEEVQVTSGLGQVTTKEGNIQNCVEIINPLKGTSITIRIGLN